MMLRSEGVGRHGHSVCSGLKISFPYDVSVNHLDWLLTKYSQALQVRSRLTNKPLHDVKEGRPSRFNIIELMAEDILDLRLRSCRGSCCAILATLETAKTSITLEYNMISNIFNSRTVFIKPYDATWARTQKHPNV